MGCITSKLPEPSTLVERKLQKAVISAKRRSMNDGLKMRMSLNSLMLHSPKLRVGFQKCRELFRRIDLSSNGFIAWTDFKKNCAVIGVDPNNPQLLELFSTADLDRNQRIDITEFSIVMVALYLLDIEKTIIKDPEIVNAFAIVEQAFTYFDSSSDGYLQRDEMRSALRSGSMLIRKGKFAKEPSKKKKKSSSGRKNFADRLYDELDWDRNGRVSFKKFLVGIERMVLEEYGDNERKEFDDDDD